MWACETASSSTLLSSKSCSSFPQQHNFQLLWGKAEPLVWFGSIRFDFLPNPPQTVRWEGGANGEQFPLKRILHWFCCTNEQTSMCLSCHVGWLSNRCHAKFHFRNERGGEKHFYLFGFRSEYLIRTIDLTLDSQPCHFVSQILINSLMFNCWQMVLNTNWRRLKSERTSCLTQKNIYRCLHVVKVNSIG